MDFDSTGLESGEHKATLLIESQAGNSPSLSQYMDVTLYISAVADLNNTYWSVEGCPTLGESWSDRVKIETYDFDGFRLKTDTNEDLSLTLSDNSTTVYCAVRWDRAELLYAANCDVPDIKQAGVWTMRATLNTAELFVRSIEMQCPKEQYEDQNGECIPCMDGAECIAEGSQLEVLTLKQNYWRCSESSDKVLRCPPGRLWWWL